MKEGRFRISAMVNALGPDGIVIESTFFFKLVKAKNAESNVKNSKDA